MAHKIGNQTIVLDKKPFVCGYASVVGKKESEGPMASEFDITYKDSKFGEDTFEKAESRMQKIALQTAFSKCNLCETDIDFVFAGDLLNQCIGSTFGLKKLGIPIIGMYGACSTMSLSLATAALFIDSGAASITASVTSSHFCSAERQYRYPLEYGSQRTPTAQWTVTGSGATILSKTENDIYIDKITFGKIEDLGIKDANNMGPAMAPSAYSTLKAYFEDTNTLPYDYDIIFTGDLGLVGSDALYSLFEKDGINLRGKHSDCGLLMFNREKQDVHAGGSGCGCSASILNSYIMHRLENGTFSNILFMSTGALLSTTSAMQGNSIPGVSHLLNIKRKKD